MSGKLCLTPTPISSDIPNKVCVDQALAETDTENTAELSQTPTKEKECVWWGENKGIMVQKICDL